MYILNYIYINKSKKEEKQTQSSTYISYHTASE